MSILNKILYSRFVEQQPGEDYRQYERRFWRARAILDGAETAMCFVFSRAFIFAVGVIFGLAIAQHSQ